MNVPRQILSVLVVGSLAVVASCGNDDPVADPDTGEVEATSGASGDGAASADTGDESSAGSTAGEDSGLPEEFQVASRPVEVDGDALPPQPGDGSADPAIGMTAPVLIGEGFDGGSVRVDAVNGGPTLAIFLAHWCSHCNAEVPILNEMRDDGVFPNGLRIVGVSTGYRPDLPNYPPGEWLEAMDWTWPAMADQLDLSDPAQPLYVAANAFGLTGFPYMVLVDSDGTVKDRWSGESEPEEILARIDAAGLDL